MAVIIAVAIMHLIWGLVFLTHNYSVAGQWILWQLFGFHQAWIYLGASWVAGMGLLKRWGRWSFIPQQTLVMISGIGALYIILIGTYPDGIERPRLFILIDQLPVIVLAIWHSWGLLWYHPGDWHQVR